MTPFSATRFSLARSQVVRREVHSLSSSVVEFVVSQFSRKKTTMIVYALVSVEKNVLAEYAAELGKSSALFSAVLDHQFSRPVDSMQPPETSPPLHESFCPKYLLKMAR